MSKDHDCFDYYETIGKNSLYCLYCGRTQTVIEEDEYIKTQLEFEHIEFYGPQFDSEPEDCEYHGLNGVVAVMWKPMSSAPWGKEVMLTGESGMVAPYDTFVCSGYRVKDWHGDRWNDVQGTPLEDAGWEPQYWADMINLPQIVDESKANDK